MASVDLTADVPLSPQEAWIHVSDLSKLGDWLVVHEAWRGDVPDELTVGTTVEGIARVKGMRNRVKWTVRLPGVLSRALGVEAKIVVWVDLRCRQGIGDQLQDCARAISTVSPMR